eukprot:974396-Rhodomonas_salina.1
MSHALFCKRFLKRLPCGACVGVVGSILLGIFGTHASDGVTGYEVHFRGTFEQTAIQVRQRARCCFSRCRMPDWRVPECFFVQFFFHWLSVPVHFCAQLACCAESFCLRLWTGQKESERVREGKKKEEKKGGKEGEKTDTQSHSGARVTAWRRVRLVGADDRRGGGGAVRGLGHGLDPLCDAVLHGPAQPRRREAAH